MKRGKKKLIIFGVEIFVLVGLLAGLYVYLKLSKVDTNNKLPEEIIENNDLPEETLEKLSGYSTIAFFGLDNRDAGDLTRGNSDVIILACVNNDTKEVKLVSVYRDTYLDITNDKGYNKANAAYAYGGAPQAVNMLNTNLDLDIKDYVTIDFNTVVKAVDILGGVELEITGKEAVDMIGYIDEIELITGRDSSYLEGEGTYNLDGVQATAYARLRTTAGDDYKRTERQRLVISKMVDKALASDVATINKLINEVAEDMQTSFSITDMLSYAKDALNYKLGEDTGFPFRKDTKVMEKAGDSVIPLDLADNVRELHEFLYDEEYQVTSYVQAISDEIEEKSGLSGKDIEPTIESELDFSEDTEMEQ